MIKLLAVCGLLPALCGIISHAYAAQENAGLSDDAETALLEQYYPAIHITTGSAYPVDFENFYLTQSVLIKDGEIVKPAPLSAQDIKPIEKSYKDYHLDYQGEHQILTPNSPRTAPIYGRVYYETLKPPAHINLPEREVIILKYNSVFTASGLPQGLSKIQSLFASLAGNKTIWHELDIHGAVHLILSKDNLKPMVLMLAQHNYFRSYVIGKDVPMPENGHIPICYAIRSNEPYICPERQSRFPTVGNPRKIDFVITGKSKPKIDGSYDIVEAANMSNQIQTKLLQLDSEHPFYTAQIPMGDIRRLFGIFPTWFRRGAPGADSYAPPALKSYTDLMIAFYLEQNDEEIAPLMRASFKSWDNIDISGPMAHNGKRFWRNIRIYY